jgi:S-adenosylmethionine:tRNA ribosyltransferase-isomerase
MTRLDLFDYELPEELIAQYPSERRDASRLLVCDRVAGSLCDRQFSDLPEYLHKGDVLVLNDSRVMHARLLGIKQETGAHIELFLLRRMGEGDATPDTGPRHQPGESGRGPSSASDSGSSSVRDVSLDASHETWEVLGRPARRLKAGDRVCFTDELAARVIRKNEDGSLLVSFECAAPFTEVLERVGKVPLPPYIRREAQELDGERYQTVYADEAGSAAAPTAGLHFTNDLLDELRQRGVQTAFVTLHVGLGTFRPVQTEAIEDHHMHEEFYHVSEQAAATINAAKRDGRRVICVGTTSVRTLESAARDDALGGAALLDDGVAVTLDSAVVPSVKSGWGSTNIFIYPGGRGFRVTDALITNFHLPKSTLLMLVSAFHSREGMLAAYAHAVRQRYRFFSYGDAMLIL